MRSLTYLNFDTFLPNFPDRMDLVGCGRTQIQPYFFTDPTFSIKTIPHGRPYLNTWHTAFGGTAELCGVWKIKEQIKSGTRVTECEL